MKGYGDSQRKWTAVAGSTCPFMRNSSFPFVDRILPKSPVAQVKSARMAATVASYDPFLWLEEVNGEKCLEWAKERSRSRNPWARTSRSCLIIENSKRA